MYQTQAQFPPPQENEQKTAQLAIPYPGDVILARPLMEFLSHIRNLKLPSLYLVVRLIKVLVLGIFKGHLCDHVMLTEKGGILNSIKGRIVTNDVQTFRKNNPYMLENAFLLRFNNKSNNDTPIDKHPSYDQYAGGSMFVRFPKFNNYKKINAQTVREYYHKFYGIKLTKKEHGNTTKDLFNSNYLDLKKWNKL